MIFAIKEVNKNPSLLPNITLGYRILDSCEIPTESLKNALILLNGQDETASNHNCVGYPTVPAIVGDAGSSRSIVISRSIGLFGIPLVSYLATCACLSDKKQFPTFFRTVPSDVFQVKAIARLVKYFSWTWVGTIAEDNDYGRTGIQLFLEEVGHSDACVAFVEFFPTTVTKERVLEVVEVIKTSSAKVILAFAGEGEFEPLLVELKHQNITHVQWIAAEGWATSAFLWKQGYGGLLTGSVGVAIRRAEIPGLKEFLVRLKPSDAYRHPILKEFWEEVFGCKINISENKTSQRECTGGESLLQSDSVYADVTQLRVSYNVYKAVYAIAYSLHNLLTCENHTGMFPKTSCSDLTKFDTWQLLQHLKKVNFSNQFGEEISFDENGDPVASYDLVNWQRGPDGAVQFVKVGHYDASLPLRRRLTIDEARIAWHKGQQIPKSVCSESCFPGSRKANRDGEPVCCFDCIPCADGEISNQADSLECQKCPLEYWSNQQRDKCIPKEIEFLSYHDAMGITLTVIAVFGASVTTAVSVIFFNFKNTPIVRANNMELSFLLLISLILCFLCALAFIGEPTTWSCMIRQTVFGISFVLCISCILGKTVVVLMAFKNRLPSSNTMKWFGPPQQRASVFLTTVIQVIICIIWLVTNPPFPSQNSVHQSAKIILECNMGSALAFCLVLGYIGLLAGTCFFLAFLARKLPDNFNEAKFITFSMLIFFTVWITFIPAYISSPGKYTVAVEIFAILASTLGLLLCIFAPKCYVILLKPEKNTKKHLMDKVPSRT
ncbi:extracellular calcium-sensing receptor-like [Latimeria chalumnae]|uniref:extracellular calcium-sensing receptor-like n=1 Tax=Latimeria chalumnae TaxID=7897 RepID=UPI0006D900B3|nr:PREDICTED: extracellular calcium-sensing receptor-like [Latimeria chalumnae]|eukprot:XP_005987414.2 PREDICTED: extracellular calcium-sensing receptor-like [Latimeria chalumnae]